MYYNILINGGINILNFINILKKEHCFLYSAIILSFIIAVLYFLFCIVALNDISKFLGFIFFVPTLLVYAVAYVAVKNYDRFPILIKIVSFILNILILIIIQICVSFFLCFVIWFIQENKVYDNPAQYQKAVKTIYSPSRIKHFPKIIPTEAKNVEFNKLNNSWFGSEAILVKFEIDKQYIDTEIKKYKYISVEKPENYIHIFDAMMTDNSRINIDDFTFFIINDKRNEHPSEHMFPYHYGIGVNEKLNQIIYYYTCPD